MYIGPKPIQMEMLKIQEISPSIYIEPGATSKCKNVNQNLNETKHLIQQTSKIKLTKAR